MAQNRSSSLLVLWFFMKGMYNSMAVCLRRRSHILLHFDYGPILVKINLQHNQARYSPNLNSFISHREADGTIFKSFGMTRTRLIRTLDHPNYKRYSITTLTLQGVIYNRRLLILCQW